MRELCLVAVLSSLVACNSGPSKEESLQVFAAATVSMSSAQSRAVAQGGSVAPSDLILNFTGPCTLGGTVSLTGTYDRDVANVWDTTGTFDNCKEAQGTLDGSLHWTSSVSNTDVTAAMVGELDFDGNDGSFSCEFDLHIAVSNQLATYSGSICGYDVQADLNIRTGF